LSIKQDFVPINTISRHFKSFVRSTLLFDYTRILNGNNKKVEEFMRKKVNGGLNIDNIFLALPIVLFQYIF
jgi:hypothetical protein